MKRCIFLVSLFIVGVALLSVSNTSSQDKSYTFTITRADMRLLDDTPDGIEIEITCRRENLATGKVGTGVVSGYIPKTDFPSWPPSLSEFRTYVVAWLKVEIQKQRRVDRLTEQADLPVVSQQSTDGLLGREITIEW